MRLRVTLAACFWAAIASACESSTDQLLGRAGHGAFPLSPESGLHEAHEVYRSDSSPGQCLAFYSQTSTPSGRGDAFGRK